MTRNVVLPLGVLALGLATSCKDIPGDFDPFDVTINVLGRGTGSGVVTEVETIVTINCHIVAGEPNELAEIAGAGNPCRSVFTDLNGLGMFLLFAAPDQGHEFVGWTGDCESVQGTTCQVSFVSREAITLTVIAEFRPGLETDAQRAIQFVRSTPGVGAALVGMQRLAHVEENARLGRVPPLPWSRFKRLFQGEESA